MAPSWRLRLGRGAGRTDSPDGWPGLARQGGWAPQVGQKETFRLASKSDLADIQVAM